MMTGGSRTFQMRSVAPPQRSTVGKKLKLAPPLARCAFVAPDLNQKATECLSDFRPGDQLDERLAEVPKSRVLPGARAGNASLQTSG